MGKRAAKHKERYVDCLRYQLQIICLIGVTINSSDQCKVLNGFGTKYAKGRPFKDRR